MNKAWTMEQATTSRVSFTPWNLDDAGNVIPGRQPGYQSVCQQCNRTFYVYGRRRETLKNKFQFCSRECRNESQRGKPAGFAQTITPNVPPLLRVRANGLVNMRLRRNPQRPDHCAKCGRGDCKIDGHHPDYSKPDQVAWLCRSCHMKAHRDAAFNDACTALAVRVVLFSAHRILRRQAGEDG